VFNTMTRVLAEYLQLLVLPVPLGADFYYSKLFPPTPTFTVACLADTIAWGAVLAGGVAAVRRAPIWTVGVLWIFVALLPVLNIVRIGVEMAERLLYLPSVGFCLIVGAAVAAGLERLQPRSPQRVLAFGVMGAVGLLLAAKTWTRNADWQNNYTFWRAEVRRTPQDPIPNNYLALEYMTRGEFDSAGAHLVASLTAAPGYWDANLNMGLLAHKMHQDSVAAIWLARAHQLAPTESDPMFFLGVMRGDEGRLADAVDVLAQAESLAPTEAWTRVCRGWYLERLGKRAEGNAEIVRGLELDPAVSLRNCVATVRP
jgi:protein O-mannosyl-transferase